MCIKVSRDESLQARSCARTHRAAETDHDEHLPFVEALMAAAQAGGGALLTPCATVPLTRGDIPPLALASLRGMAPPAVPADAMGQVEVELLCSVGDVCWRPLSELAQRLRLREALLVVLRERGTVAAWVLLVDAPEPDAAQRRSLYAIGLTLLKHLRTERRARAAMLQSQRLEDVAYASGDWLWETDAEHRYTWVLRDLTREAGDDVAPQVGQAMPPAQVTDGVGEPVQPPMQLCEVLDRRQPILRLVSAEHDGRSVR